MKTTSRWTVIIALPMVISILVLIFPFGEYSVSFSATSSDTTRLIGEIDSLNGKIAEIDREYGSLLESLPAFNEQAEKARVLHAKVEKNLDGKRERLNRRLVEMYKSGKTSWVNVIFDSKGFFDFIDRTVWSERIAEGDALALYEVQAAEQASREQEQAIIDNRRALRSKCSWAITEKTNLQSRLASCMEKLASADPVLGRLMEQPQTELSRKINAYLAKRRSPLTGYGIAFEQAEQRTGVSARLLVGLTAAESSCATAGVYSKTNHNAWGMKGPQPQIAGGIPARNGYCSWGDWEIAIQQAADFVYYYWGPAQTAMQLTGYCETGGPGSDWEKRVESARSSV